MCVGSRIKDYLRSNGISQAHISRVTGIPVDKLNLSLNGSRGISLEEYSLICGALNVGVDKFLSPKKPDVIEQASE